MTAPDVREALRYLGAANPPPDLLRQAQQVADGLSAAVQPRYAYRAYPVELSGDSVRLPGAGVELAGASARRMLAQCNQAVLLACTLGSRFDALLLAAQARDMARAVLLDALGSALVEAGCDAAQAEIAARFPGKYLTDRFSPGYGDLPLDAQPGICAALDAGRRMGLTVTQSLLMNPVKSVTAVIGLSCTPQPARIRGCRFCILQDTCLFRKEGTHCGV